MAHDEPGLRSIVFDCRDAWAQASWWAQTIPGYHMEKYDDEDLVWLKERGVERLEDNPSVVIRPDGDGPSIWFNAVPEFNNRRTESPNRREESPHRAGYWVQPSERSHLCGGRDTWKVGLTDEPPQQIGPMLHGDQLLDHPVARPGCAPDGPIVLPGRDCRCDRAAVAGSR